MAHQHIQCYKWWIADEFHRGPGRPRQTWTSTGMNDLRELELSWEDVAAAAQERQRRRQHVAESRPRSSKEWSIATAENQKNLLLAHNVDTETLQCKHSLHLLLILYSLQITHQSTSVVLLLIVMSEHNLPQTTWRRVRWFSVSERRTNAIFLCAA